jgi:hypothetical protein
VRIAGPAEHPVQLDVRVDAAVHPAEDLENGLLLEDHAGVALFRVEDPRRRVAGQRDVRFLLEPDVADRLRAVHQRQQEPRRVRVVQRVVAGAVVVGADRGDGAVLDDRAGIPGHRDLVALREAVGVHRVQQEQVQVVAQPGDGGRLDRLEDPVAARVPALLGQPLDERQRHCFSSVPHSWNQ